MPNRPDSSLYHLFAARGLTHSRRHFSSDWLGAAPNYMALRRDRPPSKDVLVALFQKLWRRGAYILAARVAWIILCSTGRARS